MVIVLTLIAVAFNLYCLYIVLLRMARIKSLPQDLMPKATKKEYVRTLEGYLKIFIGCFLLSFLFVSFKLHGIEFLPPIISVLIAGNVLYKILDEIDEFDMSKKDSDIIKDFLDKSKKDARKKSEQNKIKAKQIDLEAIREEEALKKLKKNQGYINEQQKDENVKSNESEKVNSDENKDESE